MRRFDGKTAWVSGATSGIGEAAAELFAQEGAAVAIIGRRFEKGDETAQRIRRQGGRAIAVQCDVTKEDEVAASIEATASQFGSLDILVNNAGMVEVRLLHEYTSEGWDRVIGTFSDAPAVMWSMWAQLAAS